MEKTSMCISKWEGSHGEIDEEIGTLKSSSIVLNHATRKRHARGHLKGDLSKVARTNTMESSTYIDNTTMAMLLAMSLPQGWAELPDGILDSIIQRLSCTSDLLAFIATCPTWRAVFMEAKSSYCKLFPPLLIQSCAQLSNDAAHSGVHHVWQLMDPANPSVRFHRPVPNNCIVPPSMKFVGCSYGHAIFADLSVSEMGGRFTMIDVFTGVQVSPPPCQIIVDQAPSDYIDLLCCMLTAPISSPKSYLLISTIDFYGLHVWRVGSDGWMCTRTEYGNLGYIDQIVVFEDMIVVLDCDLSLCTVHLDDPKLGMHIKPLLIVEEDSTSNIVNNEDLENSRLMVCGDKLTVVASPGLDYDNLIYFYLRDLDSPEGRPPWWSSTPAMDCEVFISGAYGRLVFDNDRYGRRAVSRANPERWGGRRGHVAYAGYSDELYSFDSGVLLPSWVTPGVLSLDG